MSQFLTIRETAKRGPVGEHLLRAMVQRGEIPGIQTGNRFLINYDQFLERLEQMSRKAVRTE